MKAILNVKGKLSLWNYEGEIPNIECPKCEGYGEYWNDAPDDGLHVGGYYVECPKCEGSGFL